MINQTIKCPECGNEFTLDDVLAADAAGYSRLMSIDDRATVVALDAARAVFREQVAAQNGRVIDMAGDSVLSVFETASGAVNCALTVQRELSESDADLPEERRLRFRIGIHAGDVIEKADGTVYGDGVNIAARLEGLALPGASVVSQAVHSMVARRVEGIFEDIGDQTVKNIAHPVRAYRMRHCLRGESATANLQASETANSLRGNLTEVRPDLYGRDDDVAALKALVDSHRLVSVVGAGGIGKTRLAQAVAHTLRAVFADGVWMVPLAPIADPALVSGAVAQALGVTLSGHKSAQDEVVDLLRNRALLLVLDNCEHVVEAASLLVDAVVKGTARVKVLATSQESLKVDGEHLYRASPLAVPSTLDLAAAGNSGAVALFVARVGALQPTFALTKQNVADAVEICRQLDGLALAIELAATRVPLLGVSGVRNRLNERFRVLTGGARLADRRHQTLHETLDWSHGLLTVEERLVFRRVGVFAGSFSMQAAQEVLAADQFDEWAVLNHLGSLVDKSLVVAEVRDPPRYRLLESTRAYALERLLEAGETSAWQLRHARAVLAMFEVSHRQQAELSASERHGHQLLDVDNLRSALDWAARADGDAEILLALTAASASFWGWAGLRPEGVRRCTHAIARVDSATPPSLEARLQLGYANLAFPLFNATVRWTYERAVELYRAIGDQRGLGRALCELGAYLSRVGDIDAAERLLREAEQLIDESWPRHLRAGLLQARATFFEASNRWDESRATFEAVLRADRETGDPENVAISLTNLANAALAVGDCAEAIRGLREALALARRGRSILGAGISYTLAMLSAALTQNEQLDEALPIAREASQLLQQEGDLVLFLDHFAMLAFKLGRIADSARALGCVEVLRTQCGAKREVNEQRVRDTLLMTLKAALPKDELEGLMREGAVLRDEEAARIALAM